MVHRTLAPTLTVTHTHISLRGRRLLLVPFGWLARWLAGVRSFAHVSAPATGSHAKKPPDLHIISIIIYYNSPVQPWCELAAFRNESESGMELAPRSLKNKKLAAHSNKTKKT